MFLSTRCEHRNPPDARRQCSAVVDSGIKGFEYPSTDVDVTARGRTPPPTVVEIEYEMITHTATPSAQPRGE